VSLIEPLFRLQGVPLPNLTFTQPLQTQYAVESDYYTYWSALLRVRAVVPLTVVGREEENRPFDLDPTLQSRLSGMRFPESFPTSKTLYEFVVNIGKALGAVPKIVDGYQKLTFVFLDNLNLVQNNENYSHFSAYAAADKYCSELQSDIANMIPENDDSQGSIIYPYPGGWITPRNTDGTQLTDDNCEIILPYPIYKIKKVLVKEVRLGDGDILGDRETVNNVDITDQIVEEKIWDILPVALGLSQSKSTTIRYTYGDNRIYGFYEQVNPVGKNIRAIAKAICLGATQGGKLPLWWITEPVEILNREFRDIEFQIEYIPLLPDIITAKSVKSNQNDFKQQHTFITNQDENIVSSQAYGRVLQNTVDRLGQDEITVINYYETWGKKPSVGGLWQKDGEKYFLTKQNIKLYYHTCICENIYDKNFNAISERIGLNALPRYYEVPNDGFVLTRKCHYQEYAVFSYDLSNSNALFASGGHVDAFFNTLKGKANSEIQNVFIIPHKKNGDMVTALLLSAESRAFGNSILFDFAFETNVSAGKQQYEDSGNWYTRDVRYTEEVADGVTFGRAYDMLISFRGGITPTQYDLDHVKRLPEADAYVNNNLLGGFASGTNMQVILQKDGRETIAFTYQLHCVSDNPDIVIGESFCKRNALVTTESDIQLKVYYLKYRVSPAQNQKIYGDLIDTGRSIVFQDEASAGSRYISFIPGGAFDLQYEGWAIADTNGNLYLASNRKNFTDTIKVALKNRLF
jgi:hypothetical protein